MRLQLFLQLRQPLPGRRDSRLELIFIHQSLAIRVDQPRDAATHFIDLGVQLLVCLSLRVIALAVESSVQFAFHACRVGQQRADVVPHRLVEQVLAHLLVCADSMTPEAVCVCSHATIVAVVPAFALAAGAADLLAVVGVSTALAHHDSLQQVAGAALSGAAAPLILFQLQSDRIKERFVNDRRHGNADPLLSRQIVAALSVAGLLVPVASAAQPRPHRTHLGLAERRRSLVRRVLQDPPYGATIPVIFAARRRNPLCF